MLRFFPLKRKKLVAKARSGRMKKDFSVLSREKSIQGVQELVPTHGSVEDFLTFRNKIGCG